MVGNFNLPPVKWLLNENTPINVTGSDENEAFCDLVDANFLQQFILGLTHIASNKQDLLLYISPEIIGEVLFSIWTLVVTQQIGKGNFNELQNYLTTFLIIIIPTDGIVDYIHSPPGSQDNSLLLFDTNCVEATNEI